MQRWKLAMRKNTKRRWDERSSDEKAKKGVLEERDEASARGVDQSKEGQTTNAESLHQTC